MAMLIDTNNVPIPTWTEPATLDYCATVASRSLFGIESGTYFGASARAMLRLCPNLHLWCADKFMVFGSQQISELFLGPWILNGQCELIQGDSEKAAEMLQHMKGRLDFAWIDDGHAEEDLRRDIRCLLPLLRTGGEILGHDFESNPYNDVARGVLSMIPLQELTFPVPRVWSHIKR